MADPRNPVVKPDETLDITSDNRSFESVTIIGTGQVQVMTRADVSIDRLEVRAS